MSGINGRLNWDLVFRTTVIARKLPKGKGHQPIPPKTATVNAPAVMVGMRNSEAKPTWWLAGTVYQRLLTSPSSTSGFMVGVDSFRCNVRLNSLQIIRFPNWELVPFMVEITIPKWHTRMDIELWKYSGNDELDGDVARVIRIEQKIDDISNYGGV